VRDAIAARRSLRDFSDAALTRDELSFLLWATQGVTAIQRDDSGKVVQEFRAAPSAGGRYPLETYIAVARVDGIASGIYRYHSEAHELIVVREDAAISTTLKAACYGQDFVGTAAVVFIWSAVPYRTEWKYAHISHRMIAMEAGHVCENLCLAAESLAAGACPVMAYQQPRVDELIGADSRDEFALYLACIGKPVAATR
jgi:SagB-type dehydrogenase family enzyme